ncbi:MAG: WD40/YVTN/BNR-like repeat-containing protein [Candidatus Tyrphobacter sp.]
MWRFVLLVALLSAPLQAQTLGSLHWRSIGPAIGGRVVAVAGVPARGVFYMGGVDGGIWKSTDYGLVWRNITDGRFPSGSDSIGAIAVAPSNPAVIYAGTGESDIRGDFITGDGVFRSRDSGRTWQYAGLRSTHTIGAIVVDPRDPNVLYASSLGHVFKPNRQRGVFKSTDGGATWHRVLYVDDKTGAVDVVMDPRDPSILYAAMWQVYRTPWTLQDGGPGSGIYKTSDGGAHWTNITHAPGFARGLLGRIGLSVAASDPRVVYAIVQAHDGGIFRSDDGGASWHRVNDEWKLRQRAFYYMCIFADPTNANTVYAPEVDALWVSHDGGRKWTMLHTPHGDNHVVWIDPRNPRVLLEGNDGGATVSTDSGATWSEEHNQPTGQFYHVALDDEFPFHVYGAQQDEGSFEGPSASPDGLIPVGDWQRVAYGESTFVAPQPGDPNVTYGSGYFSIFLRYDMGVGEYSSISAWPLYQEGAASNELRYRWGWTHPILFSPVNPHELLAGAQYVMESSDDGRTWQQISPDLTRNVASTEMPSGGPIDLDQSSAEIFPGMASLAVSYVDGNVIWAGSDDGLVHVTTDGGARWSLVTPPMLPQWAKISSIEPSRVAAGTAYLTASRYMYDDFHPYVFETTDYGGHWRAIGDGLPSDEYLFAIRQDPSDARVLFLGTKNTVYVSLNGGDSWRPLGLNLPHVQVRDIAINARQGDVVVATHGRSFWVLDNLALVEQVADRSAAEAGGARLYAPQTAWLSHAYGSSPYARFIPAVGENPSFGVTVFFDLPRNGEARNASLSFADGSGSVIRTVTLKPGERSYTWDLRYPDATEVRGFHPPVAAGGLDDTVQGPQVVPGTYTVTLHYGGASASKTFDVALDPRLHVDASALAARLALALEIHASLDALDRSIDRALTVRERLHGAARSALDAEIADLVQFDIHSSEGSLLHETKLRSHLAYLASSLDLSYTAPTAAENAVAQDLIGQAQRGQARLAQLESAGR